MRVERPSTPKSSGPPRLGLTRVRPPAQPRVVLRLGQVRIGSRSKASAVLLARLGVVGQAAHHRCEEPVEALDRALDALCLQYRGAT